MTRLQVLKDLDPATYQRHALHGEDRVWVEKNCYIDIWIEVLHAFGLDPMAMLGFTAAIDFEDDQFTFFKPSHDELRELYGVDVQELNIWRPLYDMALTHVGAGKLISTESDAFWLPDTAGTDYRRQHTKTTIVIQDLDVERRRLGYFHNAGYHMLEGEDFVETFRLGKPHDPTYMPLFAELVRVDGKLVRDKSELVRMARANLGRHVARRPKHNPVERWRARFKDDLAWIQREGLDFYHVWAFATIRQLGAAFELLQLQLEWMGDPALAPAAQASARLSAAAKTFILKAARVVASKKPFDSTANFDEMSSAWSEATGSLARLLGV